MKKWFKLYLTNLVRFVGGDAATVSVVEAGDWAVEGGPSWGRS